MDPQILTCVLRRRVDKRRLQPAELKGFRRVFRRGATYPVLVADEAGHVEGVLVGGLTRRDVELLSAFEGNDYRVAQQPVRVEEGGMVMARLFLPKHEALGSTTGWSYERWRRRHRNRFLRQVLHRCAAMIPDGRMRPPAQRLD